MNKWIIVALAGLALVALSIWGVNKISGDRVKREREIAAEAYNAAAADFQAALTKKMTEANAADQKRFDAIMDEMRKQDAATTTKLVQLQRTQERARVEQEKSLKELADGPLSPRAKEYFKQEGKNW